MTSVGKEKGFRFRSGSEKVVRKSNPKKQSEKADPKKQSEKAKRKSRAEKAVGKSKSKKSKAKKHVISATYSRFFWYLHLAIVDGYIWQVIYVFLLPKYSVIVNIEVLKGNQLNSAVQFVCQMFVKTSHCIVIHRMHAKCLWKYLLAVGVHFTSEFHVLAFGK